MLADPDVSVDAEGHLDRPSTVGSLHSPRLALGADDTSAAAADAADGEEDAVSQLAVPQTAGVQARAALLVQGLDLGHDEVALGEEGADLQLVRVGALAQDAAGKIDGADLQGCVLAGADVDAPSLACTSTMRPMTRSPISGV